MDVAELAELLSPSLFADERVIVIEAAAEAGKDAVTLIEQAATDLPPGTFLLVQHSGGGRAKALATTLQNLGASVHNCARITKAAERADFVHKEFRRLGQKVDADVVAVVIDAVGSTSANWRPLVRNWSPIPMAMSTGPRCADTTPGAPRCPDSISPTRR